MLPLPTNCLAYNFQDSKPQTFHHVACSHPHGSLLGLESFNPSHGPVAPELTKWLTVAVMISLSVHWVWWEIHGWLIPMKCSGRIPNQQDPSATCSTLCSAKKCLLVVWDPSDSFPDLLLILHEFLSCLFSILFNVIYFKCQTLKDLLQSCYVCLKEAFCMRSC